MFPVRPFQCKQWKREVPRHVGALAGSGKPAVELSWEAVPPDPIRCISPSECVTQSHGSAVRSQMGPDRIWEDGLAIDRQDRARSWEERVLAGNAAPESQALHWARNEGPCRAQHESRICLSTPHVGVGSQAEIPAANAAEGASVSVSEGIVTATEDAAHCRTAEACPAAIAGSEPTVCLNAGGDALLEMPDDGMHMLMSEDNLAPAVEVIEDPNLQVLLAKAVAGEAVDTDAEAVDKALRRLQDCCRRGA
jgi:hypothetical protein